jgi:glycosyltransferase involved in cell wall biosynthesis
VRVLFIHPAFPNQFTAIGAELNKHPEFECYGLTHQIMGEAVARSGGMPYFGFVPDGQVTNYTYPYLSTFETGLRNALGIARTLLALRPTMCFDVVIGHAGFGASLFHRDLLKCATIAYAELPGYQSALARPEFPPGLNIVFSQAPYESLLYASLMHSDLGVVPSEHAWRLLPPELQPKVRVQMEGFDITNIPVGGPATRAELGLPIDARLIGFFGRTLEAVRGFDTFIQVVQRLHAIDGTLQFLIIGDEQTLYGNELQYTGGRSFKAYALSRASISPELIHWRPALPYAEFRRHIACLDLAILPLFEGAANWSLFEAMAVGLPMISSRRCFVPEVIRDGREGILMDPYDVTGIANQALALIYDPERARALGEAAQARIRENYSIAHAARGYGCLIHEAMARRHARAQSKG